jgi:hypothetical protein
MDTSRPRTPPAPVSAGPPKGARSACRGKQKTSKSPFGFRWEIENFSAAHPRRKSFNSALQAIAVSLSGLTDRVSFRWQLSMGSTARLVSGRVAK